MSKASAYPSLGPDPNLDAGLAALQTTIPRETAMSTTPSVISPRSRPSIPQKKNHVDEVFRLKRELEVAFQSRDEAIETRDMMADDLLTAQEQLQEKEEEFAKISKELWTWKDKAEKLSSELSEQKNLKPHLGKRPVPVPVKDTSTAIQAENMRLRQQIEKLNTVVAEKDSQLQETAMMMTDSHSHSQSLIQEARQQWEAELSQKETQFKLKLEEQQRKCEAAEAQLQVQVQTGQQMMTQLEAEKNRAQLAELSLGEHAARMEVDSTSQQERAQLIDKYEAEIQDQRQRCEQFRRSSERLTSKMKQATETVKDLERSDHIMQQRVEDMKSQIAALQLQIRDYRMPGSY